MHLSSLLVSRIPKSIPNAPRRTTRSRDREEVEVDVVEEPEAEVVEENERVTLLELEASDPVFVQSTRDMIELLPLSTDDLPSAPENVGGWVSPTLSIEIDRSWLQRKGPMEEFDLTYYAPQAGDLVLYVQLRPCDGAVLHSSWSTDTIRQLMRASWRHIPIFTERM